MPLSDPWLPVAVAGQIPRNAPAVTTFVTRRTEGSPGTAPTFTVLDNVTWETITQRIGTDPGVCKLRYALGNGDASAPQTFEACLSDQVVLPKTIVQDERVVVWATRPDGVNVPLFDGVALTFDGHLAARSEGVQITCLGIAYRLWDTPIRGSTYRRGDDPLNPDGNAEIDYEPHFNPKGEGNCSPPGEDGAAWANQDADDDQRYPVFMDHTSIKTGDEAPVDWTLANAARYLIYRHNNGDLVANPNGTTLDDLLGARLPIDGQTFNYDDEATFTRSDIIVADKPIASKDWPGTLHQLVSDKGFEMAFELDSIDVGGNPLTPDTVNSLRLFIPQAQTAKPLWLQPRGAALDLAYTNLGEAQVGRDIAQVVNTWHVEGELEIFEASFLLDCAFPCVSTDADAANIGRYDTTAGDFASYRDHYRTFILDEAGEGHYHPNSEELISIPPELDAILGAPVDGVPQFVRRRRPPLGELVTRAASGKPIKAQLHIATNVATPTESPGIWTYGQTGAGTWQPVVSGWELLKDRIGIRVTAKHPNHWEIGKSTDTTHPFKSGVVKAVESLAKNTATNPKFWLRLTVAFLGDKRVRGTADNPLNSVLSRPIVRVVDAHDRYRKETVFRKSALNTTNADAEPASVVVRDDTAAATAEATAIQIATLNGITGGLVTIPWITKHYAIGDRISHIEGRSLGFRADLDGPDAVATYPVVTAVSYHNGTQTKTVLELSDANASRHSHLRHIRRRADPRNA